MINKTVPATIHFANKIVQDPSCLISEEAPRDEYDITATTIFTLIHIKYNPMEAVYISGASTKPIVANEKRPRTTIRNSKEICKYEIQKKLFTYTRVIMLSNALHPI